MKLPFQIVTLIVFSATLTSIVNAQSSREQLQQLVAQLQKTPDDNALRERIIKLYPTLEPPPALPLEAGINSMKLHPLPRMPLS